MNRDPQLLMSIQIACIGIVIVVGFFYIWRTLSRIENKIDSLDCQFVNNACVLKNPLPASIQCPLQKQTINESDNDGSNDEDEDDYSIMKACFGDIPIESLINDDNASFMIFNQVPLSKEDKSDVVFLEEIPEKTNDSASVAETDTGELSKTKLKKMNLDALKEVCQSRALSTDGTKSVLIERILASIPS